ncbi:MAG TPA: hypothetical protein VL485_30675 [Ktedonobacteraceae bacterium]|jgi:hypothetical protein|nr:hypothetical protein [Ktedonobacteraceae bacterium]
MLFLNKSDELMYNKKKERDELRTTFFHKLLHNPTVLLAPVIIVVILLTPLAGHFNPVAIWNDRSYDVLSLLTLLGPFVAAVGAWEGARLRRLRKRNGDENTVWVRQVTNWAKTVVWGLLFYLIIWASEFVITATQATWGSPLLGPPLVGTVAILSLSALGFAIGDLWSSRFVAPLVGVGLLAAEIWLSSLATMRNPIGYVTPNFATGLSVSVWYGVRSDLIIIQLTFLSGVLAVALASLAIRRYRVSKKVYPSILTVCGIVFILASFAGAMSSSADIHGIRVPLLYNAATDRPIPYTPVCSRAALPVCVHPAYSAELSQLSALINRFAVPLIGIPGAPVQADQLPTNGFHIAGNVLVVQPFAAHASDWANPNEPFMRMLFSQIALGLVSTSGRLTVSPGGKYRSYTTTQQAIALYLLQQANMGVDSNILQVSNQARTFEQSFAMQPLGTRHAWLVLHYASLVQGC